MLTVCTDENRKDLRDVGDIKMKTGKLTSYLRNTFINSYFNYYYD